jgi:hypothetical protein
MALGIKITRALGAGFPTEISKLLQVEDMGASLIRNVTLIKIPGDTNLALDLGMSEWGISLTGVANNSMTATSDGGVANFADLVSMRDWSTNYSVRLYFYSTSAYADGKIKGIGLRRTAGTEFWTFQFEFGVELLTVA